METKLTGKIIVVGDNIDTDQIYPGCYLALTDPKEIGSHCLEGVSREIAPSFPRGGIVVAGLLYLILAVIIRAVGVKKVMRFLPPIVTGPIIICIGLGLAPSAISNASMNWPLALIALAVVIIINIWGKGMVKIIPILLGVVISYVAAVIMNAMGVTNADGSAILNFAPIAKAGFVGLPPFIFAKFDLTAIFVMAPIAIASMMEHVGDISAISATTEQNFIQDPGLHRTLVGDGLATALAGMFGGPANTTYGENTGVLELSKVYDPKVIRLAACYAIVLSFIPKMAQVIGTMPSAIIGGISFILYGMISAIGIRNMVENQVDFTKSRNLIIAAVIMVCGLGLGDGGEQGAEIFDPLVAGIDDFGHRRDFAFKDVGAFHGQQRDKIFNGQRHAVDACVDAVDLVEGADFQIFVAAVNLPSILVQLVVRELQVQGMVVRLTVVVESGALRVDDV